LSDEEILRYFERVEDIFCRQRGAPLLLSPLDFEKAAEWFAAGVPIEAVEEGVRAYFARLAARKVPPRRAVCLSFAEPQVAEALDSLRAASAGRSTGEPPGEPVGARIARFLESRASALEAFAADSERGGLMPVLARFCGETSARLKEMEPQLGMVQLEKTLAPLDEELGRLVLLESPAGEVARWRNESRARLKEAGGGSLEKEVLDKTVERLARQAALNHFGLPRLSLLFLGT
jgi:hypothetical protein